MSGTARMDLEEKSPVGDAVAFLAMALVTAAAGAGAYFQLGVSLWLAALAASAVFGALAGMHRALRRPRRPSRPRADITQLEAEIAKLNTLTRGGAANENPRQPGAPIPRPAVQKGLLRPAARRPAVPRHVETAIAAAVSGAGVTPEAAAAPPPEEIGIPDPSPPLQSFWSRGQPATHAQSRTPREADVEMVQGLVKKLADQVSAAEAPRAAPRIDGAIEASLEALRATAETMRVAADYAPGDHVSASSQLGAGEPRSADRAAVLGDALSAGRADVLLEPILNLDDRRVRYYGVALRLKSADGETIPCETGPNQPDEAFGPALDGLRLARTAQLARRLAERGKSGFVFFEVGAPALGSDRFLAEFAALCQEPAAWVRQLVPTFSQEDVATFTNREWDALRDLGKAGLCFSIHGLASLDMNFAVVKTWGFEFVQIDAARFLDGLTLAGAAVPAADAARRIAGAGLTVIVRGIDEEATLAPVVASGALLGLGLVFGEPRPVKADALRNDAQGVAA